MNKGFGAVNVSEPRGWAVVGLTLLKKGVQQASVLVLLEQEGWIMSGLALLESGGWTLLVTVLLEAVTGSGWMDGVATGLARIGGLNGLGTGVAGACLTPLRRVATGSNCFTACTDLINIKDIGKSYSWGTTNRRLSENSSHKPTASRFYY